MTDTPENKPKEKQSGEKQPAPANANISAAPQKAKTAKKAKQTKKPKAADRKNAAPKAKASKPKKTVQNTVKEMETIMTQGNAQFEKLTQEAAKAGKEQTEAFVKSGNVFMKGFEDLTKTYVSWAQSSAEKNSQALKALMSCKTINEFAETQNKWLQQNFDDFMSGATKFSELSVKLAADTFEPINDQLGKSIKKATDALAA